MNNKPIVPNHLKGEFLFNVDDFNEIDPEHPGYDYYDRYVTVGTRRVWDNDKCLNDHYTDKERTIINKLEAARIEEVGDATFNFPEEWSLDQIRMFMLKHGFVEDEAFTSFLKS